MEKQTHTHLILLCKTKMTLQGSEYKDYGFHWISIWKNDAFPPSFIKIYLTHTLCKFKVYSIVISCFCWVTQLCPALCDSIDCGPPGSSICAILQARVLQWVPFPSTNLRCTAWWFDIYCKVITTVVLEIEENNRTGKTRDLFKKIEIPREHFMQRWAR